MSERAQEDLELGLEYDNSDIGDEDYAFILGPNGEIKSMVLPEIVPFELPEKIQKILELYGVHDPEQLNNVTIH